MLHGIRVLDFTQYLPGPFATLRLLDRGAEVVKIEALTGDPAREMKIKDSPALFYANNRNKKSIALNVKDEEGQKLARELVQKADVVIESFRPGVMDKLGLGYEQLKKVKSDIVYLSLTGFGQDSSIAHQGSHDINYLAISGVLAQFKDDGGKPIQPSITLADLIGGMTASEAIMSALLKRERTGEGSYIDLAMTDSVFSMMTNHAMISHLSNHGQGVPVLDGSSANYHIYETKDGRYMSLGALEFKFWRNFCLAVEQPEWMEAYPNGLWQGQPIFEQMEQMFLTRTQREWTEIGEKHDCCLFPILEIDETIQSSYIQERQLIQMDEQVPYVQTNYHAETDFIRSKATTEVGEHTSELLKDLLGKEETEIQKWKDKGIIKNERG
ncbi:CaiB/BaiF CoA transferase family protein [Salinibacillus xinjiangensis]|uniref:CoA transferase n=1 Tax=Salinibacillus xinjiangensis TaxID=1229268 RepID=A0A6G1X555_9BACI|nr:CaiB/BaiF CoA-transferase family protein [Salinibacillus xinjiangensis]MRG86133.1 CoA transferase [Salinibacillus xinjiangensis]